MRILTHKRIVDYTQSHADAKTALDDGLQK